MAVAIAMTMQNGLGLPGGAGCVVANRWLRRLGMGGLEGRRRLAHRLLQTCPSGARRARYDVVLKRRTLLAHFSDHRGMLEGGDYRARAGVVRAIDEVLLPHHRGAWDHDRADSERGY